MLIGCLGTERSKARKLPGEDNGENVLPETLAAPLSRLLSWDASSYQSATAKENSEEQMDSL